ncbi:MAG TPA: hypothetical protein VIK64_02270 [Anaerolineales bacterium]
MATEIPTMAPTLLDRVTATIKTKQEERQEVEEAWVKAEHKFQAKIDKMDYDLETLRRVKERLTSGE